MARFNDRELGSADAGASWRTRPRVAPAALPAIAAIAAITVFAAIASGPAARVIAGVGSDAAASARATTAASSEAPPVVQPGADVHAPPSDAIVLFDGSTLDGWRHRPPMPERANTDKPADNAAARWILDTENNAMQVRPGSGGIFSTHTMGAAQVHIEFMTPPDDTGTGQGRGNSGVYLHGRYEVQVLDSFENETHPDGQCAAIYGIAAPMVNASRPPGEWQTYDIVFHPPQYDADTLDLVEAGTITVFHNGVLVHNRVELPRPTTAAALGGIVPVDPDSQPILYLQDHGDLVRYRNIWVRPIG
ncbi:MAG: 3-keto-disaccharide hydrolase [Planctomycetota bacterium]